MKLNAIGDVHNTNEEEDGKNEENIYDVFSTYKHLKKRFINNHLQRKSKFHGFARIFENNAAVLLMQCLDSCLSRQFLGYF